MPIGTAGGCHLCCAPACPCPAWSRVSHQPLGSAPRPTPKLPASPGAPHSAARWGQTSGPAAHTSTCVSLPSPLQLGAAARALPSPHERSEAQRAGARLSGAGTIPALLLQLLVLASARQIGGRGSISWHSPEHRLREQRGSRGEKTEAGQAGAEMNLGDASWS